MSVFQKSWACLIILFLLNFLASCGALPRVETPIHEGPQGTISLKVFPDPALRATHPSSIGPNILKAILGGLYVQETQTMLESALTEALPPVQAFSREEISFLIPHIVSGLETATPEEEIVFQLNSSRHHKTEFTKGSLYFLDSTIHLTISGYRATSSKTLLSRPSTSFNRPKLWKMHFYPGTVLSKHDPSSSSNTRFPYTLSVNLPLLAQVIKEQSQTPPTSPKAFEAELQQLRESIREQNQKLERLENQIQ